MLPIESERAGGRLWRPLFGKARLQLGSIQGRVGAADEGHVCSAQALMVFQQPRQLSHRHVRRGRLGGAQHWLRRQQVLPGLLDNPTFLQDPILLLSWDEQLRQQGARSTRVCRTLPRTSKVLSSPLGRGRLSALGMNVDTCVALIQITVSKRCVSFD